MQSLLVLAVQVQRLQQTARRKEATAYSAALQAQVAVKAVPEMETQEVQVVRAEVQVVEQAHLVERLRLHRRKATTAEIIQQEMLQVRAVVVAVVLVLSVVMEAAAILTAYQAQVVQV